MVVISLFLFLSGCTVLPTNILENTADAQTSVMISLHNCQILPKILQTSMSHTKSVCLSLPLSFSPSLCVSSLWLQMLSLKHSLASWPPAPSWMSYCLYHDIIVFSFPLPSRVSQVSNYCSMVASLPDIWALKSKVDPSASQAERSSWYFNDSWTTSLYWPFSSCFKGRSIVLACLEWVSRGKSHYSETKITVEVQTVYLIVILSRESMQKVNSAAFQNESYWRSLKQRGWKRYCWKLHSSSGNFLLDSLLGKHGL